MSNYTEKNIRTLEWNEHIRRRPGMYIGKLGDGASPDDGIYILIKEVIDNSVDEFAMGYGKLIDISVADKTVSIRDFGRGIPLGSLVDASSKINTGGKYDDAAFKKSVGLNGVGLKAVNALSVSCLVQSYREGESHFARFSRGELVEEGRISCPEKNGTLVTFVPDEELFDNFEFNDE
ncbi:MAG: ATP-binding protein, partial [Bacteroidales bacterium]|nr:ATP-binding protein [Bacteroidales bacterium]